MAGARHYDEELRTIGQALEARDISVFELKRFGGAYTIQGTPDETGSQIRQWLQRLRGDLRPKSLSLTIVDIEGLSQAGKSKRSKSGQLADFRKPSNILRTIGAYIDSAEVELLELQVRRISVTLSYRDKEGQKRQEDRTISSFYRLFLELSGKRRQT